LFKVLRFCPICGRDYNRHWKVINHIRKTHDKRHQNFLKKQEKEVVNLFLSNKGRVGDLFYNLYKIRNIFCGISYTRIDEILEKYIQKEEIKKIQRKRTSSIMKKIPKTPEHNHKVSLAVKKAWKEGKFDTVENIKARKIGYEKRKSFKGKNNPMYGKPSPKGAGRGKGGIRKDIGHYVRSSWEANICRVFKYVNRVYEYESKRFKIIIDEEKNTYCPDFYFPDKDFYYELKGHAKSSSNWDCECSVCIKNKKKIEAVVKKYKVKIIVIGNVEYKKFKRRFRNVISGWEK